MFTRRNVVRGLGIVLVIGASLLGFDKVGDGEYLQAVVWFAVAALWIIWLVLSPSFAFDDPGKKPTPLQWVIPIISGVLIAVLQVLR